MATSIRQLKLDMQIVGVYMRLQLIRNCFLQDLGQVGQVRHRAVVTEDFRVMVWPLDQRFNDCFSEGPGHSARFKTEIYYLLKTGRNTLVNSSTNFVDTGSTTAVVSFDVRKEFKNLSSRKCMKAREHVRGQNTGDKVFFYVRLFRGHIDKALPTSSRFDHERIGRTIQRLPEVSCRGESQTGLACLYSST